MSLFVFSIQDVAIVCHEANAAYCRSIGDNSQKPWSECPEWQRDSAMKGVQYALQNPDAPVSAQHEAWLKDKYLDGWKYGPTKDPGQKTHPCMVHYNELPAEQRMKDYIFKAVVDAFRRAKLELNEQI